MVRDKTTDAGDETQSKPLARVMDSGGVCFLQGGVFISAPQRRERGSSVRLSWQLQWRRVSLGKP